MKDLRDLKGWTIHDDRIRVGWPYGEGHKTKRCRRKPLDSSTRRVTYPESYITKSTTFTKNKNAEASSRKRAPLETAGTPILNVGFKTATLQNTICTRIR
jgi:hypothetical protein